MCELQWTKVPWLDQLLFKNRLLLWLNEKGWYNQANPFDALTKRQVVERQKYWQERDLSGKPGDKEMIFDMIMRAQKEHPELHGAPPIIHAFSIIGGASESM